MSAKQAVVEEEEVEEIENSNDVPYKLDPGELQDPSLLRAGLTDAQTPSVDLSRRLQTVQFHLLMA